LGSKSVLQGQNLLIEAGDAKELVVGEKITLMKWGIAIVTSIEEVSGVFTVKAELKVEDTDYKKTKKLTWITEDPNSNFEVTLVELDHLITKKKVEENEKVSDIVNYNSRIAYNAVAEGNMKDLKKGDIISFQSYKNIETFSFNSISKNKYVKQNFYSFVEVDFYTKTLVVVKDLNDLTLDDFSLLITEYFDLKKFRDYL
jgi:hypothetical protein